MSWLESGRHALHYVLQRLSDPGTIFFWPYVASGLGIVFGVLVLGARLSPRAALRTIFPAGHWLSRAVRADAIMSSIQVLALDAPMDAVQFAVFGGFYGFLRLHVLNGVSAPVTWQWPVPVEALVAATATVLSYDLATWVAHWLAHRVPLLWEFHSVHHSATRLNPFSLYRDHPVDRLLRNVLRGVFTALAMALLHLFLPRGTWAASVMGVGVGFLLYLPTVHLHHFHIPVRYPQRVRLVFISPHLHHLHHSSDPRHFNRNLGVIFSLWDRLFGTYLDETFHAGDLTFGLPEANPYGDSIVRCYLYPFLSACRRVRSLSWFT